MRPNLRLKFTGIDELGLGDHKLGRSRRNIIAKPKPQRFVSKVRFRKVAYDSMSGEACMRQGIT